MTDCPIEDIKSKLVICSISGGKDSTAMALHLRELGIKAEYVFADTGWESWITYSYIDTVLRPLLGDIDTVRSDVGGMRELVKKKAMFPGGTRRFCTDELKMRPIVRHMLKRAAETGREVVSVVGVRAAESAKRAAMPEVDGYTSRAGGFEIWRPLIRWTEQDVIDIHHRNGIVPNPLYLRGAQRVGCWPCIHARKSEVRLIANIDPARIDLVEALEAEVTEIAAQRAQEKGEELKTERTFFIGKGHKRPKIRDVVEWSNTSRGGQQFQLLGPDPDAGCLRWGMCEHPEVNE